MIDFNGDGEIDAFESYLTYELITENDEKADFTPRPSQNKTQPKSYKGLWGEAALAYLLMLLGGGIGANIFTVLIGIICGVIVLVWICGGLK